MNKILNLKFLIIAGSIFLGTLVVLLTTGIYNPSWNPFTFASQRNLNKAIGKMTTLDNLKTQGNVWVEVTTVDKEKKPITLNFSFNPSVSADFKNKKGLSDFNLTGEIGGLSVSFDGEIRLVNDEFYFQIKNLSVLLSYMGMGKFQDKWIKLSSTSTPAEGEKNQGKEKIKEFFKEVMNELKRKEIIKVKRNLGEEKVDGIQCSHYLVILDNKNLKDIALLSLGKVKDFLSEEEKKEYEEKLKGVEKDLPQKFDEFSQKFGEISFEIWIDKESRVKKIKGEKEIDLTKLIEGKEGKIKIGLDFNLFDFDKEVKVEIPKDSIPLEDIIPKETLKSSTSKLIESQIK
ncbi:hypothetical protein CO122_00035 [bacterium (Candidatus Gribaldobacteria) CG_4_9_14_3_um_filter_33_9]|nr:MAG: hypothetical protein CO122_00035 [bacterium (Candidatus Gribaldobacteria) CG_4_9_14_3_um_filter_33_9]